MYRCLRLGFAALLAVLCASAAVGAPNLDALVGQLSGEDELARAEARQLLPRAGVQAVPRLLPLLADSDARVWWAAFNVLSDIGNEVSAPGRDKERAVVADYLMELLAPEQPTEVKLRGLRLLPVVVPEGHDIGQMRALLSDSELRERARVALEETATANACRALRKALRRADADFQCALLNSLGRLQDGKSLSTIRRYTKSDAPRVRAAAVRALSWAGDAASVKAVRSVYAAADAETAFDAADAMIRCADAAASMHGDIQTATAIYREVLATSSHTACRGAALVGLVRHGDDSAADAIAAALNAEGGRELEPAVLAAFEHSEGEDAQDLMLELYPVLSEEMRLGLLGVFGRKQVPMFLDILKEAARAPAPDLQAAAIAALADSRLPEAVPELVAVAERLQGQEQAEAVRELKRLADALANDGKKEDAGAAFLGLYRVADSYEERRHALDGVARFPTAESFDVVMEAIDAGELTGPSAATLSTLAKGLIDAGRDSEAERAIALLMAQAKTPDAIGEVIRVSQRGGGIPNLANRLGFVTSWLIAGPFPWNPSEGFKASRVNEPDIDTQAVYEVDGKSISWRPFTTPDSAGVVNLAAILGGESNTTAYGVTHIEVDADIQAVARIGSDDGIKLWANGVAIHENNTSRGVQMDQDKAPVHLKAGRNTLLVEVTQGGGGWGFCLRLTEPDGAALRFSSVE